MSNSTSPLKQQIMCSWLALGAAIFAGTSLPSIAASDSATTSEKLQASTTPSGKVAVMEVASTPKLSTPLRLHAEVSNYVSPELNKQLDDLIASAHEKINRAELLEKEKHYKKGMPRVVATGKDLLELCTAYRGFEQSSEAADIILNEKTKLKSRAAISYVKQRQTDKIHSAILTAMMQIASGLGLQDPQQSATAVQDGANALEEITNNKELAQKTVDTLKTWCAAQTPAYKAPLGGPLQIQAECKDVVGRAIQNDQGVKEVVAGLHKYNQRSKFARTTAKVVNTTLSITSLSPTIISPISQVAWTAYIATQGGPEESKLLKEVYLAKRFESRFQTLTEETNLAVNSYNSALSEKNPALLAFSQFVLTQLVQPAQNDSSSPVSAKDAAREATNPSSTDVTKEAVNSTTPDTSRESANVTATPDESSKDTKQSLSAKDAVISPAE